jgi:hypothetical protein
MSDNLAAYGLKLILVYYAVVVLVAGIFIGAGIIGLIWLIH